MIDDNLLCKPLPDEELENVNGGIDLQVFYYAVKLNCEDSPEIRNLLRLIEDKEYLEATELMWQLIYEDYPGICDCYDAAL